MLLSFGQYFRCGLVDGLSMQYQKKKRKEKKMQKAAALSYSYLEGVARFRFK